MPFFVHRADLGPDVLTARGFQGDVHVLVVNSRGTGTVPRADRRRAVRGCPAHHAVVRPA